MTHLTERGLEDLADAIVDEFARKSETVSRVSMMGGRSCTMLLYDEDGHVVGSSSLDGFMDYIIEKLSENFVSQEEAREHYGAYIGFDTATADLILYNANHAEISRTHISFTVS